MKKYIKNYLDNSGLQPEEVVCEVCGAVAVDIHHVEPKGIGGSKLKDGAENLIALCRECHERAHGQRQPKLTKEELKSFQRYV